MHKPSGSAVAAYLRISSDTQDASSQKITVDQWANKHGLIIAFWYEDSEGRNSRDKAEKRANFQRLLKAVEAGLVDVIVVDRQDRFGTKDAWEFGKFVSHLQEYGCELWSATQGLLSSNDDAVVLTSTLGAITSRKEQIDKGFRQIRARVANASKGLVQGGYPAYGMDHVCFSQEGDEKWRVVYEGHHLRLKLYPIGDSERYDGKGNFPSRDQHDELRCRPSIRTERVETVRQIFEWYATESISPAQIASRLRDLGVDPVFDHWQKMRVQQMLENPIYVGLPTWNKQGQSRFAEFVNGEIREVASGKIVTGRDRDEADFVQPAKPEFLPIVPLDVWEKVKQKRKSSRGNKGKRCGRSPEMWLFGLLYCGNCGKAMHSSASQPRLKPNYFCSTYNKFGPSNPTNCRCHRVKAEIIEPIVMDYLRESAQIAADIRQTPLSLLEFLIDGERQAVVAHEQRTGLVEELAGMVASIAADDLTAKDRKKVKSLAKGSLTLDKLRQWAEFFDSKSSDTADVIERLEAEIQAAAEEFLDLPKSVKPKAKRRIEQMESDMDRLKASAAGYAARLDRIQADLKQFEEAANAAQKSLETAVYRQKTELVKAVIEKIVLHFRYSGRDGKPTAKKSFLDRVEILPRISDSACFIKGIESGPN